MEGNVTCNATDRYSNATEEEEEIDKDTRIKKSTRAGRMKEHPEGSPEAHTARCERLLREPVDYPSWRKFILLLRGGKNGKKIKDGLF